MNHGTELRCEVSFTTPAFLGDADQNGQWRTPPFKALLRQWWRVAETKGRCPDASQGALSSGNTIAMKDLHRIEGDLFGRAAVEGTTASQVRLRLDWRATNRSVIVAKNWKAQTGRVRHEEAEKARFEVDAALYLGYGPLNIDKATGNSLKRESALTPGLPRSLTVRVPDGERQRFHDVIRLAHAFGSLGSRCRNGWGSLHFQSGGLSTQELAALLNEIDRPGRDWLRAYSRDWRRALDADWCHAIGQDDKGLLLWRTTPLRTWEEVLMVLAEVKIAFRTKFQFMGGGPHLALCDRHVIAYPVTNHRLKLEQWGEKGRSANQVQFKVLPQDGMYCGLIVHLPHGVPTPLKGALGFGDQSGLSTREQQVWRKVHAALDKSLTRLP